MTKWTWKKSTIAKGMTCTRRLKNGEYCGRMVREVDPKGWTKGKGNGELFCPKHKEPRP